MGEKVYLISPPANETRKSYPYSLIYLSSFLRKNGFDSEIIDCDVLGYNHKKLVEYLSQNRAKVVGITGYSRYRFSAYQVAKQIKEKMPECTVIAGGRHFSALAEDTLSNIPEIDLVVRDEGEITLKEVVEKISKGDSTGNVKGISYRDNGKIVSTPERELEKNIEKFSYGIGDLPKGPYHLKTRVGVKKSEEISNAISVMSSRGCPGSCVYCCLSAGRVRYRNPKAVVDEIVEKMQLGRSRELNISDSSFTVNKKHVTAICEEILNRNLDIKWTCQSRANIDVEILRLMKRAGCVGVSVGVESAEPKVLKAINKKINIHQVMDFLEMCKGIDLTVLTYFMVSLPEETEKDAETTFRFIKEITPFIYKPALQITQLYPDARLFYMAKEKHLLPDNFDWFGPYSNPYVKDLGGRENLPFYFENLSPGYLKEYLQRYKKYYFRHFYYKDEFKNNIIQGMKCLIFDWENESIYRKINRIKNGVRAVYGNIVRK